MATWLTARFIDELELFPDRLRLAWQSSKGTRTVCVVTPGVKVSVPLWFTNAEFGTLQLLNEPLAVPFDVVYCTVTVPCSGALSVTGRSMYPSVSPATASGGA